MARRRSRRDTDVDPFYDMLFNILIAFVFCFIIAVLAMNPKAKKAGDVLAKAEFIITVSWPDNDPNDIDTWVQDPAGNLVWFHQREAGLMHLDRDDRGTVGDTILVNGREVINPLNQEVATLRGFAPGEYTVNVQYYESRNQSPVDVTVSVVKVNPRADVVLVLPRRRAGEAGAPGEPGDDVLHRRQGGNGIGGVQGAVIWAWHARHVHADRLRAAAVGVACSSAQRPLRLLVAPRSDCCSCSCSCSCSNSRLPFSSVRPE